MTFASATAVTKLDEGRFLAEVAEGWDIFGAPNGGYLLSMVARAMAAETDGRDLVSITGYYANRASVGPVTVDVEQIKVGSTLTMLGAAMRQEGRPLVTAQAVFANPEGRNLQTLIVSGSPPELPPPEECVHSTPSDSMPLPPPFVSNIDVYIHPEDVFLDATPKTGTPRVRGWFRLKEDEQPDPMAAVLASDSFPPAIFNSSLTPGWTPTVELTVHVRDSRPFDWLSCELRTRFVTGGWLEEDGELWDDSGRLVAQSRQLALVAR